MMKRNGPGGCCCTCTFQLCVTTKDACDSSIVGTIGVVVKQGSTVLATGTTDAVTGQYCVTITVTMPATVTILLTPPGGSAQSHTLNMTTCANQNVTYSVTGLGKICVTAEQCELGMLGNPQDISGIPIAIMSGGTTVASGTTNVSGVFCAKVAAGNYTASGTWSGGLVTSSSFTVSSCNTTNVTQLTSGPGFEIDFSQLFQCNIPCTYTIAVTIGSFNQTLTCNVPANNTANPACALTFSSPLQDANANTVTIALNGVTVSSGNALSTFCRTSGPGSTLFASNSPTTC